MGKDVFQPVPGSVQLSKRPGFNGPISPASAGIRPFSGRRTPDEDAARRDLGKTYALIARKPRDNPYIGHEASSNATKPIKPKRLRVIRPPQTTSTAQRHLVPRGEKNRTPFGRTATVGLVIIGVGAIETVLPGCSANPQIEPEGQKITLDHDPTAMPADKPTPNIAPTASNDLFPPPTDEGSPAPPSPEPSPTPEIIVTPLPGSRQPEAGNIAENPAQVYDSLFYGSVEDILDDQALAPFIEKAGRSSEIQEVFAGTILAQHQALLKYVQGYIQTNPELNLGDTNFQVEQTLTDNNQFVASIRGDDGALYIPTFTDQNGTVRYPADLNPQFLENGESLVFNENGVVKEGLTLGLLRIPNGVIAQVGPDHWPQAAVEDKTDNEVLGFVNTANISGETGLPILAINGSSDNVGLNEDQTKLIYIRNIVDAETGTIVGAELLSQQAPDGEVFTDFSHQANIMIGDENHPLIIAKSADRTFVYDTQTGERHETHTGPDGTMLVTVAGQELEVAYSSEENEFTLAFSLPQGFATISGDGDPLVGFNEATGEYVQSMNASWETSAFPPFRSNEDGTNAKVFVPSADGSTGQWVPFPVETENVTRLLDTYEGGTYKVYEFQVSNPKINDSEDVPAHLFFLQDKEGSISRLEGSIYGPNGDPLLTSITQSYNFRAEEMQTLENPYNLNLTKNHNYMGYIVEFLASLPQFSQFQRTNLDYLNPLLSYQDKSTLEIANMIAESGEVTIPVVINGESKLDSETDYPLALSTLTFKIDQPIILDLQTDIPDTKFDTDRQRYLYSDNYGLYNFNGGINFTVDNNGQLTIHIRWPASINNSSTPSITDKTLQLILLRHGYVAEELLLYEKKRTPPQQRYVNFGQVTPGHDNSDRANQSKNPSETVGISLMIVDPSD
ncbi:hypothetical protein KC726_04445 [Candidatus Woesebacteria bacterium]|nr:hypothetical protein [Candidatus Woesebacteria bacterium]